MRERLTFQILCYEIIGSIYMSQFDKRADVWVVQGCDRPGVTLKAFFHLWILRQARRKNLDRDGAIQARIGRLILLSHDACAEGRFNLVWTKFCSGFNEHMILRF